MARGDFEFLYGIQLGEMQEKESNNDRISLKNSMAAAIANGMSKDDIQELLNEAFAGKENSRGGQPIQYIAQGTHGTCSWDINKEGTLRIYPTNGFAGTLRNQVDLNCESPWRKHAEHIKHVVVGHGVNTGKDARSLFAGLDQCETMKLDGLNTSKAELMRGMFYGDSHLRSLDLKNFDFKSTIDTSLLCNNCENLISLNIPTFEESKVINTMGMFNGCKSLEQLNAGRTNFKEIASDTVRFRSTYMFDGCPDKLVKKLGISQIWKPDRIAPKTQSAQQQKGMGDPNYWMNKFKPTNNQNKTHTVNKDDGMSR